jgi:hypothetical protein
VWMLTMNCFCSLTLPSTFHHSHKEFKKCYCRMLCMVVFFCFVFEVYCFCIAWLGMPCVTLLWLRTKITYREQINNCFFLFVVCCVETERVTPSFSIYLISFSSSNNICKYHSIHLITSQTQHSSSSSIQHVKLFKHFHLHDKTFHSYSHISTSSHSREKAITDSIADAICITWWLKYIRVKFS